MNCVFTDSYRSDPRGPVSAEQGQPKNAGPDGWRFLHLSALDGKLTQKLAREFGNCIGCLDCRIHFQALIEQMPVTDQGQAFARTVAWHNEVNRRRGVRELTLEESRRLWTGPRKLIVASSTPLVKFSNAVVAAL